MNLETLYYLGQIIAVLAILASLMFVAYQIRLTRNQMRGAATIAVLEYQAKLVDKLLSDDDLYKLALRGNEDMDSQGALDKQLFAGKESYWFDLHSSSGRRAWWNTHAVMLDPGFKDYVSKKLAGREVKLLRETSPIFNPSKLETTQ